MLKVVYTDTDSLLNRIVGTDVYDEFKNDILEWFDTSDYDRNHPYDYSLINKKIVGLMKDELKGQILEEIVGKKYML